MNVVRKGVGGGLGFDASSLFTARQPVAQPSQCAAVAGVGSAGGALHDNGGPPQGSSPAMTVPGGGVDTVVEALGDPWSRQQHFLNHPLPIRLVCTLFKGAAVADPTTRAQVESTLAVYQHVVAAVCARGYHAKTEDTFVTDLQRMLRVVAAVDWPVRSEIVRSLSQRWTVLLSRRLSMVPNPADCAAAVVEEWQAFVLSIVNHTALDRIPAFDIVRCREGFVDVAAVLLADRNTLPQLKDCLLRRDALFRLATDTVQALMPADDLRDIAGWTQLPPLVQLAAAEYAAGRGRSVSAQRTALQTTAVAWAALWMNSDDSAWLQWLSQMLGDAQLPRRLEQTVAPDRRQTIIAGWRAAVQSAFASSAPARRRVTVADLDLAVQPLHATVQRSLSPTPAPVVARDAATPVASVPGPLLSTIIVTALHDGQCPRGMPAELWQRRYAGASTHLKNLMLWMKRNRYTSDVQHDLWLWLIGFINTLREDKHAETQVEHLIVAVAQAMGQWATVSGEFTADVMQAEATRWVLRTTAALQAIVVPAVQGNSHAQRQQAAQVFTAYVQGTLQRVMAATVLNHVKLGNAAHTLPDAVQREHTQQSRQGRRW